MKALTIKQPYVWAIMAGHKAFEYRTWQPPDSLETFAIHAGKGFDTKAWRYMHRYFDNTPGFPPERNDLVFGAVVGIARILDVWKTEDEPETELHFACGWQPYIWAWHIDTTEYFKKPIPAKGHLGLWNWERP